VPDANLTFVPGGGVTSTSYDAGSAAWNTTVAYPFAGNAWLAGVAFPVTNQPAGRHQPGRLDGHLLQRHRLGQPRLGLGRRRLHPVQHRL